MTADEEHKLKLRIAELTGALLVVKDILDGLDDIAAADLWADDITPLGQFIDRVLGAKE